MIRARRNAECVRKEKRKWTSWQQEDLGHHGRVFVDWLVKKGQGRREAAMEAKRKSKVPTVLKISIWVLAAFIAQREQKRLGACLESGLRAGMVRVVAS